MKKLFKLLLAFTILSTTTIATIPTNTYAIPTSQVEMSDSGGGDGGGSSSTSQTGTSTGDKTIIVFPEDGVIKECRYFLGMVAWDCNVTFTQVQHENGTKDPVDFSSGIWTIAANILTDISVIATYLIIGYVIYGGYLYMFSSGDPNKVTSGKKTLTQAFIGLAIVMLSSVILNAIRIALGANFTANCTIKDACYNASSAGDMITNAIGWVIGVSGVVAAIFLVVGGFGYITSSGEPQKLQKAKNTILYSLIGLAVVALATVITATVSSIIREASDTSSINQITIAKELYEKNH